MSVSKFLSVSYLLYFLLSFHGNVEFVKLTLILFCYNNTSVEQVRWKENILLAECISTISCTIFYTCWKHILLCLKTCICCMPCPSTPACLLIIVQCVVNFNKLYSLYIFEFSYRIFCSLITSIVSSGFHIHNSVHYVLCIIWGIICTHWIIYTNYNSVKISIWFSVINE